MRFLKWLGIALSIGIFGVGLGIGLGLTQRQPDAAHVAPSLNRLLSPAQARAEQDSAPLPGQPGTKRSVRHTIIVDVAQRISPAVVSIGVTKKTISRQFYDFGGDLFFSPYILGPQRQNFPYLGSGFIIDKKGHVLTNYHVVEDSDEIFVTLTDRRTFPAKLLDADRFVDVALLQIEKLSTDETLPAIPLGNSSDIMIGETVLAIGNPFGPLIADPRPSVSMGVVSAVNRSFKANEGRIYQDMIQTDAAINPGNSGGPLVNLDGEAVGINTFIFSRSGDSSSVGFSIPINRAARIADEIIRFGKVRSIRKDFDVIKLTPFYKQALGITSIDSGALVHAIDENGPAQRAGLEPGDVIVHADEKAIEDDADLIGYFLTRTVGETVRLRVIRQNKEIELNYQITEGSSS